MKFEVGKLYRHHMITKQPGERIRGCFVKRGNYDYDNGMYGWNGGINTIGDITEYADAMLLVEFHHDNKRMPFAIFLVGDRFIMMDPYLVEPV